MSISVSKEANETVASALSFYNSCRITQDVIPFFGSSFRRCRSKDPATRWSYSDNNPIHFVAISQAGHSSLGRQRWATRVCVNRMDANDFIFK